MGRSVLSVFDPLRVIARDFTGLCRVCGVFTAARWLFAVCATGPSCGRAGNLQPADRKLGEGPFRARSEHGAAMLTGEQVISGIREIWVRNVYLRRGYLEIAPDAVVVDLGANMGNFTLLALAHGPGVKVVGAEPNLALNERFRRQMALNGWADRVALDRCFIGGRDGVQQELLGNPDCSGAEFLDQEAFVKRHGLERIDFLKCDIEGGEFRLFGPESLLLKTTRQLAVEVHDHAGDRHEFIKMLERSGFEVGQVMHLPHDCIVHAKRGTTRGSRISRGGVAGVPAALPICGRP